MHRSRLSGFTIDCQGTDTAAAARFWSEALGMKTLDAQDPYVELDGSGRDLHLEVQSVAHESRVHLDIETDDVEAEAARLEALGARRIGKVRTWWVMESPTGQRFCVVRARDKSAPGMNTW